MEDRCKTVQENLAVWQEEELPLEIRQQCDEHIAQCSRCRHAAEVQREVSKALRRLRQLHSGITPPPSLWRNVSKELKRRESHKQRMVQWQAAFASILAACLIIGGVWAKLNHSSAFPAEQTLQNYRQWYNSQSEPVYESRDPAAAAKWLSDHLHASVLPIDLSLSQAKLNGADVVQVGGVKMGRLLYLSGTAHLAIYVSPAHTEFRSLNKVTADGNKMRETSDKNHFTLFAWAANGDGYAVVSNAYNECETAAVDAERQTNLP